MFEYLAPSWWGCLGRIRMCGTVGGGVSLRWAWKFQSPCQNQAGLCRSRCKFLATTSASCLAACCRNPHYEDQPSGTSNKFPVSCFLLKVVLVTVFHHRHRAVTKRIGASSGFNLHLMSLLPKLVVQRWLLVSQKPEDLILRSTSFSELKNYRDDLGFCF